MSGALRSNAVRLRLSPAGARRYVEDVERRRRDYRAALRFYPHGTLNYTEVFYEDLVRTRPLDAQSDGVVGKLLDAVQRFLDVPPRRLDVGVTKRMHPGACGSERESKLEETKPVFDRFCGVGMLASSSRRTFNAWTDGFDHRCRSKIANWREVARALRKTEAVRACV